MAEYVVFDLKQFSEENRKADGNIAESVLGVVRSEGPNLAQDTASQVFPDHVVFTRELKGEQEAIQAAAMKRGYLNTSDAHTF